MPTVPTSGYLVRHLDEAPTVPCPCGASTRILTAKDQAPCSLHVTRIQDSVRHYHRVTTEVYYILEGTGKMELNGDWVEMRPGMMIWIEAGTRHRLVSDEGVQTIVFGLPAFDPADEYFD